MNELRDALGEESPAFQEYSGIAAAAAALADETLPRAMRAPTGGNVSNR